MQGSRSSDNIKVILPNSRDLQIPTRSVLSILWNKVQSELDPQNFRFLQSRLGRHSSIEILPDEVNLGMSTFWNNFHLPFAENPDTRPLNEQIIFSAVEDLAHFNGCVTAGCTSLARPFAPHKDREHNSNMSKFDPLAVAMQNSTAKGPDKYFIAIVLSNADHFLIDQLSVIVHLARGLGPRSIYVSILDDSSDDSTPMICDLVEAVLTLLNIPFRIKALSTNTRYYPLREALQRNAALEPLHELNDRQRIRFQKVIWLKGFTCPNDVLDLVRVSLANKAHIVCGLDWVERDGSFVFSDRWRARDMRGDLLRAAKSSTATKIAPVVENSSAKLFKEHMPFQMFCCESGSHVVDAETYYRGVNYEAAPQPEDDDPEATSDCMDSTQMHFCRKLWRIENSRDGSRRFLKKRDPNSEVNPNVVSDVSEKYTDSEIHSTRTNIEDAVRPMEETIKPSEKGMSDDNLAISSRKDEKYVAKVLMNPRSVTTYGGVSHTKLALDLFTKNDISQNSYEVKNPWSLPVEWRTAPDSYVCQEIKSNEGRKAPKSQKRLKFVK